MTTEAIRTQQALITLLYAIRRVLHIIPPFMRADVLAACEQAEAALKADKASVNVSKTDSMA